MTPADTRTAILDQAEELIRHRSFNAFSYHDVAEKIGIRKASIHYHFPSKEDLGLALIERFRARAVAWASSLVEREVSLEDRLAGFFNFQGEALSTCRICPQGVLGAEYNALPERMREAYVEFLEEVQGWLTRLLANGRDRGVFRFDGAPENQALLVQSAVQGALQIARASGRPERYAAVVAELKDRLLVEPAVPAAATA